MPINESGFIEIIIPHSEGMGLDVRNEIEEKLEELFDYDNRAAVGGAGVGLGCSNIDVDVGNCEDNLEIVSIIRGVMLEIGVPEGCIIRLRRPELLEFTVKIAN